MKSIILLLFLSTLSTPSAQWLTDFKTATAEATVHRRLILLNFSGSDWCGPCIQMHKQIFNAEVFTKFADSSLILVNADFPRSSKNRLSAAQQKTNDALADTYNKEGHFPYTVLLKPDGTIIKTWDGLPKEDATTMITEIKAASSLAYP
jgi:thiol-disulfide isomerase/thioredoxin